MCSLIFEFDGGNIQSDKANANCFLFRLLACKSLLWVCIFSCSFSVHLVYLSPNQFPNIQNHIYLNPSILILLTLMHPIVFVYIYVARYSSLQSKQIVLTFIVLGFFCFVGGPTSITDLELITCFISLCTVLLDPKYKFMNFITIQ